MPHARQIVEQIQQHLTSGGGGSAAELSLAYAEHSRPVHERLNRCHDYLARGLRSEAVQEADLEPPLLGLAAALTLENFQEWDVYCRDNSLPRPHDISRPFVAELNRAYAADQMLAPLLRSYRHRCLARAPLPDRVATLRGLAGLDPHNHVWNESLVELEKHRLPQLQKELADAAGDTERLTAIQRELLDDRRRVPAPAALVRDTEDALRSSRVVQAQHELRELLPALDEAYSAMDHPACRRLLDGWTDALNAVGGSQLRLPDDLREPVQPILDWVQTQDARHQAERDFRAACGDLRRAVGERSAPDAELDRAYERAAAFGRPLPDDLAEDHRRATDARRRDARRRRRRRLVVAAAAALLVTAGAGALLQQRFNRGDARQRLAHADAALDRGELAEATAAWDGLAERHPAVAAGSDGQTLRSRIDAAQAEAGERRAAFDALATRLTDTPAGDRAESDLAALASLADPGPDRETARSLQEAHEAARAERHRALDRDRLAESIRLGEQLDAVTPASIDAEPDAALARLDAVRDALTRLNAAPPPAGPAAAALTATEQREAALRGAADAAAARSANARARDQALARVLGSTTSATALAAALERFATEHPDPRVPAEDFRSAAREGEAWLAVEAWQRLQPAIKAHLAAGDPAEIAGQIRAIDDHLTAYPRSPLTAPIRAHRAALGRALLAASDSGPWRGKLPDLLKAPVVRDLNAFVTRAGERYYVVDRGQRRETSLGTLVDVVLTPDTTRSVTREFPPGDAGPIGPSPQAALAARLRSLVAAYRPAQSDTFHLTVLETVLDAPDVDAVLRAVLVTLILDETQNSLGDLEPELAAFSARLAAANEPGINWLDPTDITAATIRTQTRDVLTQSRPDFAELRRRSADSRARRVAPLSAPLAARGVLRRDRDGLRIDGLTSTLRPGWTAYVAAPAGAEAPFRWISLGTADDDGLAPDAGAAAAATDGAMVFVFAPPPKPD